MTPDDAGTSARDRRQARLAASLRENLKRRKAQQRSRAAGEASDEARPQTAEERPGLVADEPKR
jgi:hypothetical protein